MTHTKDEALKLALEALERIDDWFIRRGFTGLTPEEKQTVAAIEAALAQPAQEPNIKHTKPFESARIGDYNRGWNDCLFASAIVRDSHLHTTTGEHMKEALKRALDALEYWDVHGGLHQPTEEAITALRLAIDVQNMASESTYKAALAQQELVVERAWFTIAELNAWANKKLLDNPQWVMPTEEPERTEALAQPAQQPAYWAGVDFDIETIPPQRTWVGLDEKDFSAINQSCLTKLQAATSAESILKEKNNG